MPASGRRAEVAVACALLVVGVWSAAALLAATWPLARLPLWDGAGNGWGSVELGTALADLRPVDFALRLNEQDKWPFGYSLLALPFLAADGFSFRAATLLPALAFALVPLALYALARELAGGGRAMVAAGLGAALWCASPQARALATVPMRETAGALVALALVAAFLRARRLGTLGAWRLAAAAALALFLVKYNYFLLAVAPLALGALVELDPDDRRRRASELWRRVAHAGWRAPERWGALVVAASIGAFAAGVNPGGLIYAANLAAVVVLVVDRLRGGASLRGRLAALAPPVRAAVEWLAAPVALWWLSPDPIHPRNFFAFLRNRPGEATGLVERVASPLRLFEREWTPTPALGVALLLLASGGLVVAWRRGGAERAVALVALGGWAMVSLHPMREARFLATVAPFVFLLAAWAAVSLLAAVLRGRAALAGCVAALLATTLALFAGGAGERLAARLDRDHRALTGDPALGPALEAVVVELSGPSRAALVGGFNQLSESLVRWRGVQRTGRETPLVPAPRGIDASTPAAERAARVERWLARGRPTRIVIVEPRFGSRFASDADYLRYNAWQVEIGALLAARPEWSRVRTRRFRESGLRLAVWERADDRTPTAP